MVNGADMTLQSKNIFDADMTLQSNHIFDVNWIEIQIECWGSHELSNWMHFLRFLFSKRTFILIIFLNNLQYIFIN